jgi:hypothetical protein
MHEKQLLADLRALAFLSLLASICLAATLVVLAFFIEDARLRRAGNAISHWLSSSRSLAVSVLSALLVVVSGYSAVLLGASLGSHDWTLSPGQEKYFCELDCHLAYSVAGVEKEPTIGNTRVGGDFYIITLRTRFDEHTISPNRGSSPLEPGPRVVTLVDSKETVYTASPRGQSALAAAGISSTPLTQPLSPGDSYLTRIVFDLPKNSGTPRLLIRSPAAPDWLGYFIVGDEGSILHHKVFLALSEVQLFN